MRYVYMALIALFVGVIVLFKVQNLEAVTVSLFSSRITRSASLPVRHPALLTAQLADTVH